jgi:hypothetical protein
VLLLGVELAPLASTDKVLSVSHRGWPVEARPEGFHHQVGGGGMVAAFATVDFL